MGKRRQWTRTQILRTISLVVFLLLTAYGVIRHRFNEASGLTGPLNAAPSVDSLSPFGGLETLWSWVTSGEILRHLHLSDLVLLLASVVLGLSLGGAFCGWICPFGAVQEWLYRLRARLFPRKISVPPKLDRYLRYFRYVVLSAILMLTWSLGEFFFGEYCPWNAVWQIGSEELAIGGAVVLGLVVLGGLAVERAWCRYACPLGAVLGLANKIAPVRLERTEMSCKSCSLCNKRCPMDIDIVNVTRVTDTTCIRCLECVDACPKPDTLDVKAGRKRISGWVYGSAAAAIFAAVIGLAMATGNWESYATAAPPPVDAVSGLPAPEELKGWRTLQEVVDTWKLPADILYRETGLDPQTVPLSTPLKDLEALTEAQLPVVDRTFVADLIARYRAGEIK